MRFSNGYSISVQWGAGNYCDNHHISSDSSKKVASRGSSDAEVAIIQPNGDLMYREDWCDEVCGYLTTDKVLELMKEVASYDNQETHPS